MAAPLTKIEILEELEELVRAKRRIKGKESFQGFISLYLNHLRTHQSPNFHKEIIGLLDQSIKRTRIDANQNKDLSHNIHCQTEEKPKEYQGGVGAPQGGEENNSIVPPDFFPEISKLSLDKLNRLLFIAPRGFAKSTLCSIFFPLWLGLNKYKTDIFLVSATISLARELLRKIRAELENNELFLRDYGEMKSEKWTEDFLLLANGVAIRAKGRGFQIRGFRPDIIICDDLEDEESLYSKDQRDKLENWFFRTLLPALKPDQNLVYIGTKLHQLSLISKLEQKEEFVSRKYLALVQGKSIWEDLWKTESLLKLRQELGTYAFEAEFQNNPLSLEEQPVRPQFLEGVKVTGQPEVSCLVVDPAISEKESSDYRAIGYFERTKDGFREVYSEHSRCGITELVQKILDFYEKFKPNRIILEEVAFQQVLRKILTEEARKKHLFLPISSASLWAAPNSLGGERKRPRDKLTRLMSVVHLFEQRLVEVRNPDMKAELLVFPFGDYDDLVDTIVYGLFFLMNWQTGGLKIKLEKLEFPLKTRKTLFIEKTETGEAIARFGEPPFRFKGKAKVLKF